MWMGWQPKACHSLHFLHSYLSVLFPVILRRHDTAQIHNYGNNIHVLLSFLFFSFLCLTSPILLQASYYVRSLKCSLPAGAESWVHEANYLLTAFDHDVVSSVATSTKLHPKSFKMNWGRVWYHMHGHYDTSELFLEWNASCCKSMRDVIWQKIESQFDMQCVEVFMVIKYDNCSAIVVVK